MKLSYFLEIFLQQLKTGIFCEKYVLHTIFTITAYKAFLGPI